MAVDPIDYWRHDAGPRWVRGQAAIDHMFAPITEDLVQATDVRPEENAIDIGCGSGTVTIRLADAVGPRGSVLGIDISDPLLAHAKERTRHLSQVRLICEDATSYPFVAGEARAMCSRFGVMFFHRPVDAFRNLRQALETDGRFVFACWQAVEKNPWVRFMMDAFPDAPTKPPPDGDQPGPFRLAPPKRIESLLTEAGFGAFELTSCVQGISLGESPEAALVGLSEVGPFSRLLAAATKEERPAVLTRGRKHLEAYFSRGAPPVEAAYWRVIARP
ncbi:MAG: class I SAM-dependent methyltransferase [Myxococcota bacterium]